MGYSSFREKQRANNRNLLINIFRRNDNTHLMRSAFSRHIDISSKNLIRITEDLKNLNRGPLTQPDINSRLSFDEKQKMPIIRF